MEAYQVYLLSMLWIVYNIFGLGSPYKGGEKLYPQIRELNRKRKIKATCIFIVCVLLIVFI